jgi:O-antigen ligase
LELHLADDAVTLALLGLLTLLVGLPGVFLIVRKITRPPLQVEAFRWLYLAWACLLAAGLVWSLTRVPLYAADQAGANNYIRLAFLVLGFLTVLTIGASYRFAFLSELWTGGLKFFFFFSLWGLASTLWSVYPAATLYKSFEYCAMLALFALTASLVNVGVKHPRDRMYVLRKVFDFGWFLFFLLMVSVYLGIIVWPEYGILRDYRDVSGVLGFSIQGVLPGMSADAVGQLGAIVGIVALTRVVLEPRARLTYTPVLMISLATMVLTQARSPILAFSVAVLVVLIMSRRFGLLVFFGFLAGSTLLTQYGALVYEFLRRGQDAESLTSLTGRVDFWQASFQAIGERPIGGYGANAGGRYVLQSAFGEARSSVHSTWVGVLVDTGAIGLVLLVIATCATWFWLFNLRSHAMGNPLSRLLWFECLGVLTVLFVRSIFSVDLVWAWDVLLLGLVLVFINVVGRQVVETRYSSALGAQPLPATRRRRPSIRS